MRGRATNLATPPESRSLDGWSLRFVSTKNVPEATNPLIQDAEDDRDVCPYVHSGSFLVRHRHAPC